MPAVQPSGPARVVPRPPQSGDTLGIIAPGSLITADALRRGCEQLQKSGFKTFYFDSILEKDLYFAGSHERRARELEEMFSRADIAGIVCARGGYGCNHLLPLINLDFIRANPKFFMGYSDVTTLLSYFCDQAGLVTYHGPMVAKDFADGHKWPDISGSVDVPAEALRPGQAQGTLYGGCFSMLAASLGTPYEIQTAGTILFIEDVNTKPFQIDRMLMQLKLAGKLNDVRAFIFGPMLDCVQPGGQDYTVQDVILRTIGDLNVPIAFGVPFGHLTAPPNLVMPLGIKVWVNITANRFTMTPA
ncbi:MAG: LD-carboxypeptidase [Terriglobales bacterium]